MGATTPPWVKITHGRLIFNTHNVQPFISVRKLFFQISANPRNQGRYLLADNCLHTVRIDGYLRFGTSIVTKMVVDTIVVTPNGTLEIGTENAPIQEGVSATILFADNGPINTSWDPSLLSRGLISLGEVIIFGAAKTPFMAVAGQVIADATQFNLDAPPVNWQIGDAIVLTAANYRPAQWDGTQLVYQGTYDEERVIRAVNSGTITVDALSYDHLPPYTEFSIYAANFSRNVVIANENEDVPTQ